MPHTVAAKCYLCSHIQNLSTALVSTVIMLWSGWAAARGFLLSSKNQTGSGAHPHSYSVGTEGKSATVWRLLGWCWG
jgi:hypothetical protein